MPGAERIPGRKKIPWDGRVAVASRRDQFRCRAVVSPAAAAGEDVGRRRNLRGHHRAEKSTRGTAAGEGGCRSSEPGEERLPGEHEPRDSNADERDPGDDYAGAGNEPGRGTAGLFEHGEELRRIAAHAAERHSGSFED